jgi:hypothetical protein
MEAAGDVGRILRPLDQEFWRQIKLENGFRMGDVDRIRNELNSLIEADGKSRPVWLLIVEVCAGDLAACMLLCKLLRDSPIAVYGLAIGPCLGPGFCVLQACGVRYALPQSILAPSDMTREVNADTDLSGVSESLRLARMQIYSSIRCRNQQHSRAVLMDMIIKGTKMTPSEALREGFIDKLYVSRSA